MSKLIFPPVEDADVDGFLGVSRNLTVEDLLDAYTRGIFPWPWSEEHIAWFAPPERAVLFLDQLRINRSLKRALADSPFTLQRNCDFKAVIEKCRNITNRKGQKGTWITKKMVKGYCELFRQGFAESFETYRDDQLVGGMYGVRIGNYFSAESMFYEQPNASKFALIRALEILRAENIQWVDCQVINPVTQSLGAVVISRKEFTELIVKTFSERK